MFLVGPNPYGICCTLGLQGKSPEPKDLSWFIGLAEQMRGRCIELHFAHIANLSPAELDQVRERLQASSIQPVISGPWPLSRLSESIPFAKRLGAQVVRTHLSPVLCGARAAQGDKWPEMVQEAKTRLTELGLIFSGEGLTLALENHQDFGSEELLEFCDLGGDAFGIALDTGNPLAVGEAPIPFAKKVASKVRHVHLKDYRVQPTPEGYRLVRCPIGDGAVPFPEIESILSLHHNELTASLEPGALDARHVKLLTDDWWQGYPVRSEAEKQACLEAARINALPPDEDWRTPWEQGAEAAAVCRYEMDQMMKSIHNMQTFGWLPA